MTETEALTEVIIDSMKDGNLRLLDVLYDLCSELQSAAKRARREADDYTNEELDFWRDALADAERVERRVKASSMEISQVLCRVREAYGNTGAALLQMLPTDDQIIAERVRLAHGHLAAALGVCQKGGI